MSAPNLWVIKCSSGWDSEYSHDILHRQKNHPAVRTSKDRCFNFCEWHLLSLSPSLLNWISFPACRRLFCHSLSFPLSFFSLSLWGTAVRAFLSALQVAYLSSHVYLCLFLPHTLSWGHFAGGVSARWPVAKRLICVSGVWCVSLKVCVCVCMCSSVVSDEFRDLQLKQTVNSISPVPFIVKIWLVKLSDWTFITCFNISLSLSDLYRSRSHIRLLQAPDTDLVPASCPNSVRAAKTCDWRFNKLCIPAVQLLGCCRWSLQCF